MIHDQLVAEKRKQQALQEKKDKEQKQVNDEKKEIDLRIQYLMHINSSNFTLIFRSTVAYFCYKFSQRFNLIHLIFNRQFEVDISTAEQQTEEANHSLREAIISSNMKKIQEAQSRIEMAL